MTIIDAGLFLLVIGVAFIMLFISFKFGAVFKMIAMILFFVLSLWMFANDQVAYKSDTFDPTTSTTQNTTKYIISDTSNGTWLGYIFLLFGIVSGFLFFMELIKG